MWVGVRCACYNDADMATSFALISRATRPMIGSMIGVGLLALPFAFAQVGFGLGTLALVVVALVSGVVLELYADLVLVRGGKARFIHVMSRELGHGGTFIAAASFIGSIYGALIAFCIFGGQFLRTVLFGILPLTPTESTIAFFALGALLTIGGSLFVARMQRILLPVFFCLIAGLALFALPHVHLNAFTTFVPSNLGAALGVMLFAFHGMCGVPEARDILGRSSGLLSRVSWRSIATVFCVYLLFSFSVLGVTGASTTENAIVGLNNALGHSAFLLASTIALVVTMSAFMNVANALTYMYVYDLKLRFIPSWLITMLVPIIIVLIGIPSMTSVLKFTGGVLGTIVAICMLVAYERARMSAELPKRSLRVPQLVVGLTFCVFVVVFVGSIVG